MTRRESQEPLISRCLHAHPPPGIIVPGFLGVLFMFHRQSGLCGMKAVASHPEGQLTMKEPKPRMYLWDYRRDLELSGKQGGKFLFV